MAGTGTASVDLEGAVGEETSSSDSEDSQENNELEDDLMAFDPA